MTTETPYGTVTYSETGVTIEALPGQLYAWSTRPGHLWPCSGLADLVDPLMAQFDRSGLVDIEGDGGEDGDILADEFNAWSSDVLRDVLPAGHPAYFVTVGQFDG